MKKAKEALRKVAKSMKTGDLSCAYNELWNQYESLTKADFVYVLSTIIESLDLCADKETIGYLLRTSATLILDPSKRL